MDKDATMVAAVTQVVTAEIIPVEVAHRTEEDITAIVQVITDTAFTQPAGVVETKTGYNIIRVFIL